MSRISSTLVAFAILTTLLGAALQLFDSRSVGAADSSDFKAGRIIDDAVFYNEQAMNSSEIQAFLNSKVPTCDTNGTASAADWGYPDITHAQLAERIRNGTHGFTKNTSFHAPPYTCLKNFKQNTPQLEAEVGLCGALTARTDRSAAQIINDVSKACGINPRVLLVLLHKEQSLVTDTWPLNRQYTKATGFGCPDSTLGEDVDTNQNGCYDYAEGFFKQVYYAARQFKVYRKNADSYNYIAGRTNRIYWHPSTSCGTSDVFIENQATAALYIYTPYRPNKAALDNLYGTGNSCSSYGNRNFWRLFTDWFGSTRSNIVFRDMKTPRWMQAGDAATKIDPFTGSSFDETLTPGEWVYFTDALTIDGVTYLRTEDDSADWLSKAIPVEDLEEITLEYTPMQTPRWMQLKEAVTKTDPLTRQPVGEELSAGTAFYFSTLTRIGGVLYIRTQADTHNGQRTGIPYIPENFEAMSPEYVPFALPRWMIATTPTKYYDLRYPGGSTQPAIPAETKLFLDTKVELNGKMYASDGLPVEGEYTGIPLQDLRDIGHEDFSSMKYHRAYQLLEEAQKTDLSTGLPVTEQSLEAGTPIYFQSSIIIDEVIYLRSARDGMNKAATVIPLSILAPIEVQFEAMEDPRVLQLRTNSRKVDPVTLQRLDTTLAAGQRIMFTEKIIIGGKLYLRTAYDAERGHYKVIALDQLRD
jgi:hypothetical protein